MLSRFKVTRYQLMVGWLKFGEICFFSLPKFLGVGKKIMRVGFQA